MPPKKRIFREDILNAALDIIRRGGAQALTVRTGAGVMVNQSKVVATDVQASNGVIHVIDTVLAPKTS